MPAHRSIAHGSDAPGHAMRKSPTRDELRVWREFIETVEALRAEIASRMQRESGLSLGDYSVLLALGEAPGTRLRSSELATVIGWERSRLSHQLGRMERRGLIRRQGTDVDNRGAEVVRTPEGATAFRQASAPHLRDIRELFVDALDAGELAAAANVAAALRAQLDQRE
jgi:DNA-binding MarR family transcriptional regulator